MGRTVSLVLALLLLATSTLAKDYKQVITADVPTHWWRLDTTSGTTANDSGSGSPASGTYNGGFSLSQVGILGYAGGLSSSFNGTTGWVDFSTQASTGQFDPSTTNNQGWGAEAWVNVAVVTGSRGFIISHGENSFPFVWAIYTNSDSTFQAVTYSSTGSCGGTAYADSGHVGAFTAGTWHHVALSTIGAGSTTLKSQIFYVDGAAVSTITSFSGTICTSAADLTMAARKITPASTELWINGRIDEVALYSSLSAAQVSNHYRAGLIAHTPRQVRRDEQPSNPLKWFLLAGVQ